MYKSIKTGDTVKILSGEARGKEGKIVKIDRTAGKAFVEGIGIRTRHMKKTQFNPAGGKKDIHVGINISNLAVIKKSETKVATKKTKKEGK